MRKLSLGGYCQYVRVPSPFDNSVRFCFVAPLLANEVESDEGCFERIKTTLLDLKKRRAEMNPPLDRPDEYIDTLLAVFEHIFKRRNTQTSGADAKADIVRMTIGSAESQ